jgi:hypothetical protein
MAPARAIIPATAFLITEHSNRDSAAMSPPPDFRGANKWERPISVN